MLFLSKHMTLTTETKQQPPWLEAASNTDGLTDMQSCWALINGPYK